MEVWPLGPRVEPAVAGVLSPLPESPRVGDERPVCVSPPEGRLAQLASVGGSVSCSGRLSERIGPAVHNTKK